MDESETTTVAVYRHTARALRAVADWHGESMADALERVAGKAIRDEGKAALKSEQKRIDLGENGGS
jgi:hypothetical protein